MPMLASLIAFLRGPADAAVRAVPRNVWIGVAALVLALYAHHWFNARLTEARAEAGTLQAGRDRVAAQVAADAAAAAQQRLIETLAIRQSNLSKGTADALSARLADLARRSDALRLQWAAYRSGEDAAGGGQPVALPGAAGGADRPACAAAGWVSFDTAAAAALAADRATAKDDAWIAWAAAQQAAWPAADRP